MGIQILTMTNGRISVHGESFKVSGEMNKRLGFDAKVL